MDTSINKTNVWYITGVSSGVGLSLCEELLKLEGNKVVGTSRGDTFADSIKDNANFLGLQVDLTSNSSIKESIEKTLKHFGDITHVINNAGFGIVGTVEEMSEEEDRKLFDILYHAPVNVIKNVLPYFRSKRQGYILNISSTAGFKPMARFGAYSASKAAISALSESLALEVEEFNIKVATVFLGFVITPFHQNNDFCQSLIKEYNTVKHWKDIAAYALDKLVHGCPNKIAKLIIENGYKHHIPSILFIGPIDCFTFADSKISYLNEQLSIQKERNTDCVLEYQK